MKNVKYCVSFCVSYDANARTEANWHATTVSLLKLIEKAAEWATNVMPLSDA